MDAPARATAAWIALSELRGFAHHHLALIGLIAILAAGQPAHSAESPSVETGPAPNWAVEVGVPDTAGVRSELLHDGVADLLSDTQVRIGSGPESSFNRYVSQVIEPSGVSMVGRIQVEFAPTYQSLTIHWIRLMRDGVVQERLDPAEIRILQQEEDLDLNLYYQAATALVLLDDVRVGDRVDYAYSIVGANPIFEGRYQDWHYLEWWYPFGRIHVRIIAPANRPLHFTPHNTKAEPIVSEYDGQIEYVWLGDAIPTRVSEDTTPPGYDPLAALQVSEFGTWGEVARWASETFDTGVVDDADVLALADRIRSEQASDAERIVAALRFVQDDIRYLGLEIGVNAYRPHPPAQTLERRYGDCKDKSRLLVALLRDMGITAHVALVHTELGKDVAKLHPTASAFDHAIVRVETGGRQYWIDPTASYERGPLEDEQWFEYDFAMVVDPDGEALTVVEPSLAKYLPARVLHRYVTTDYDAASELEVTSTYRGDRADQFRGWVASMARDAIERQYQNYYARDRKGIELTGPIVIEDDESANVIVVHERYRVPDLWQWSDERERFVATFTARELRDELSSPDTVQRSHPLAFSHPVQMTVTIEIETPEPMTVNETEDRVVGPAFELDYEVEELDQGVRLTFDYRSKADRIEPEAVAAHLEAIDEIWAATHYRLTSSRPGFDGNGAGELTSAADSLLREPWRSLFIAALVFGWLYGVTPRLLLRRGLRSLQTGHLETAIRRLLRARRLALPRTTLHRRSALVLSVLLGLRGRIDEARGVAATLTRMPTGRPRNDAVATAAWAWRSMLLRDTEPDRALACADQAVALGQTLPGDETWPVRSCALLVRAQLREAIGHTDGAQRDLKEARLLTPDDQPAGAGWASVLPLIASASRIEIELMPVEQEQEEEEGAEEGSKADRDRMMAASREWVDRCAERWPTQHPVLIETRLWHAEQLARRGVTAEAWRELDLVREALPASVDAESPLHARAKRLADLLEAN